MVKATDIKKATLMAQGYGYLTLAKGHCKAGNAFHARLYLEEAKRLRMESQNFTDPDETMEWTVEELFRGAA
jgi:hypothetical protein